MESLDQVDQNSQVVGHKEDILDLARSCQEADHNPDQIDQVEEVEDRNLRILEAGNSEVGKVIHLGLKVALVALVIPVVLEGVEPDLVEKSSTSIYVSICR